MRKFFTTILLSLFVLSLPSVAMTEKEVRDFLALDSKVPVSYLFFLQRYPDSPFKKTVKEMFVDSIVQNGKYSDFADVGFDGIDDFFKLELARIYKKRGLESDAKRLYLDVFSKSNNYDEQIFIDNAGDLSYLTDNKTIIASKVWFAIKRRNFDVARFYLSFLPRDNRFYLYFKGIILYRTGNRKEAIECFKRSSVPEALFFRLLLERNPFGRVEILRELIHSDARRSFKVSGARIVLNRLLVSNLPLFKLALESVKELDGNLYREYLAKYYVNTGQFEKALRLLDRMNVPFAKGLSEAIKMTVFGKQVSPAGDDFYSFILTGKLPRVQFREPSVSMIKDEGLRYIIRKKKYFLLDFVDFSRFSPFDLAVSCYLAGRFRDGIRFASKALPGASPEEKAVLYTILYPAPSIFGNDVVSLSIARQESLFDPGAFSRSGAIGYMQIMPATGKHIASVMGDSFTVANLFDSKINISYGTFYIKKLIKQFGSFPMAAAAYNAGPGRIRRLLNLYGGINSDGEFVLFVDTFLPLDETRNYVKKVVSNCFYYSKRFGKKGSVCRVR
ncbi:lytic transglycosylase domain-containing protein [Desulfurobacterium sp.]